MRKLAILVDIKLLLIWLFLELSGIGLVAVAREGNMYQFIQATGQANLFIMLYMIFFFVYPVVNLIALLVKDRGVLVEHKV